MIEEIEAKQLIYKVGYDNSRWFGNDYNMNLYKGCCHGCIYCDSRSSCYRIENFDNVRVKANSINILERELRTKRKKGVISIGAMSDTYNPFEEKLEVTRNALRLISKYGFGVSIDTKSSLITRDIDILKEISLKGGAIAKITITACDDTVSKKLEPNVNPSSERFKALKTLSAAGIFCGVLLTPVLPFITDSEENIKGIIDKAAESGANFVFCMRGVTLRENQREYFLNKLTPPLRKKYIETYGLSYNCDIPNSKQIKKIIQESCRRNGLMYRMDDIIKAYKKNEPKQLSFFE